MTEDVGPSGFWSYVRKDDDQVDGRIVRLAKRIGDEFSLITGQDLDVFVDRDAIDWGHEWAQRINVALQETTFFIPVITPRYFMSQACRDELLKFSGHAKSLGAEELLLPIYYIDAGDLEPESADEAKALIAKTQYVDWRDLRLVDESSEKYRRAVNEMALRLAEIGSNYSQRPSVTPEEVAGGSAADSTVDDEPGVIDLVATLEDAMPRWQGTIESLPGAMQKITDVVGAAAEKIQEGDKQNKGFAYRVVVAREMAADLADPAQRMEDLGEEYTAGLLDMDQGVRALISLAGEGERSTEERDSACEIFSSINELVATSRDSRESVQGFADSLKQPAKQLKDLRPALGKINKCLQSILDGQAVLDEWERLISESPLQCSEAGTSAQA